MSSFLAKFLRIIIALVILTCGTYYIVYFYSDSLAFLIDFDRQYQLKPEPQNTATQTLDHKETQTESASEIHNQSAEVVPEVKAQNIRKSDEYYSCLKGLSSFNSISIKFLEDQSCHNEIVNLKSFGLPELIKVILDEIEDLCQLQEEDLIQNEMLSKMLQVKKISVTPYRKMKFLVKMDKLKVYFYSEDFIKLCKQ